MNSTIGNHNNLDPIGEQTLEAVAKASRLNEWLYLTIRKELSGEILEIGSGIGNISAFAIKDGLSITLSDFNSAYRDLLRQKFSDSSHVREILAIDLQAVDFSSRYTHLRSKFDSIFLTNVIEHLKDDKLAIENCNFLLKPGGALILLAPAYSWLYCKFDSELGHYRRYTCRQMTELVQANGFQVRSTQYFNFIGIFGWLFFGKILRRSTLGKSEMSVFDKIVPVAKLIDKLVFRKMGLSITVTSSKK